ncbi:hypothetical protein PZA11_007250 [Diplocarpon coronariae]
MFIILTLINKNSSALRIQRSTFIVADQSGVYWCMFKGIFRSNQDFSFALR